MNRLISIIILVAMLGAATAFAADIERPRIWGRADMERSPQGSVAKAAVDTFLLMGLAGSGAPYAGDFEAASKTLDPLAANGWSSIDISQTQEMHWQLSDYQQTGGDTAAWCGDMFPACTPEDPVGGYGNSWNEMIELRATVANPGAVTPVTVQADLQVWTEAGYDHVYLSRTIEGVPGFETGGVWDGPILRDTGPIAVNTSFLYHPGEYLSGNQIAIQFRFVSDYSGSDEDCYGPEMFTAGACQVDNITVTVGSGGGAVEFFDDFESGWGNWLAAPAPGVGDFTKIWEGLEDIDACNTNYSRQVAWIDDGVVVPGTGGTQCITWCYGPSGYIVNNTGGLVGDHGRLMNYAVSPVMGWPDGDHGGLGMDFDVYRHLPVTGSAPLISYTFDMRSADLDRGQVLEEQPWQTGYIWLGGVGYIRQSRDWTAKLEPGRDLVQVRVGVVQSGIMPDPRDDGTPAPYFDNIRLVTYAVDGPRFEFLDAKLAQDAFPAAGVLDLADLSRNSCRFDMAANIAPTAHLRNDPGDSIVIDCASLRAGGVLLGPPVMHWRLQANPVFDAYRTAALPNPVPGIEGNGFHFDLPDSGFLFPGDRLQYYFEAIDDVGGDPRVATLPDDLTGLGDFAHDSVWDERFQMNCLPGVRPDDQGGYTQSGILFWNDFGRHGDDDLWLEVLLAHNPEIEADVDVYRTRQPESELGNGLGGRATLASLAGYQDILYSAGDLAGTTLSSGEYGSDPGDDVGLLEAWLGLGDRDLLVMGENVAFDLASESSATAAFLNARMGVDHQVQDVSALISGQLSPRVVAEYQPEPIFGGVTEWIAQGGCPGLVPIDGVLDTGDGVRVAQFTDPMGDPDVYSFAAATLCKFGEAYHESRVLSLPYDLCRIIEVPGDAKTLPISQQWMSGVLIYFGWPGGSNEVPAPLRFSVAQNAPNPFNPLTRIDYTMPREGLLTIKVFDIRGLLVKVLHNGTAAAGPGQALWDGTDTQGSAVASGVYFYETRTSGDVRVNKMALIR